MNKTSYFSIKKKKYKKLLVIFLFLIILFLAQFLFHQKQSVLHFIMDFLALHPILAPLYFILGYAVAAVLMIPTLPLNLMAGIFFGAWLGGIWSVLGSVLGATIAFLFARSVWGGLLVRKYSYRWMNWLERELEQTPWKVVAFVRLFPGIPSGPINFIFGLTNVPFATYVWASLLFLFPAALVFSAIGHAVGMVIFEGGQLNEVLKLTGMTFAGLGVLTWVIPYFWKKRITSH